ncbi:type II toxin-antitoxin system VapB family antitoxin [Candidatus Poriferisocius sp.]|uniref:type II toxin-antitoxin system VapB family antitoxin n=1 Tax=Candidatus Poriferisocius sp. TaxID=3101276 RepID=UPI003B02C93F
MSIKSAKADQLARELAALTGKSITVVITESLETQLDFERRRRRHRQGLSDIVERFRLLPVLNERAPDEVIGYDQHGLPA